MGTTATIFLAVTVAVIVIGAIVYKTEGHF